MSARFCLHFPASPCLWKQHQSALTSPDIWPVKAGANPQNWQLSLILLMKDVRGSHGLPERLPMEPHTSALGATRVSPPIDAGRIPP